jgi:hypothetical protein
MAVNQRRRTSEEFSRASPTAAGKTEVDGQWSTIAILCPQYFRLDNVARREIAEHLTFFSPHIRERHRSAEESVNLVFQRF